MGQGCCATNTGVHQAEDWCRMCGQNAGLKETMKGFLILERELLDAGRLSFQDGEWNLFDSGGEGLEAAESLGMLVLKLGEK